MRIAVTGGIAEGKSTVLAYLAENGYQTASSDQFARECFSEASAQDSLAIVLGTAPPVTPAVLREALAGSPEIRRAVNRLMHPAIVDRILSTSADFIEVPLLIETCLHPLFDQVWVVTCGLEEQLRRLTERAGEVQARQLMDTQLRTFAKTPFGDVTVRTNVAPETVKRFIWHEAEVALSS